MQRQRGCKESLRAFTLIELLVVVAIIVVLMALMMPALSRAREQSKTTVCASNMRQIGIGIRIYASEYDNFIVPYYTMSNKASTGSALRSHYAATLVVTGCLTAPSQPDETTVASIGHSVFRCPSGANEQTPLQYSSALPTSKMDPRGLGYSRRGYRTQAANVGYYDTWYAGLCSSSSYATRREHFPLRYNYLVYATGEMNVDSRGDPYSLSKFNQITRPTDMGMLFDGGCLNTTNTVMDFINVRHNSWSGTNILFADGHAEFVLSKLLSSGALQDDDLTEWNKYSRIIWRLDQQN